MNSRNETQRNLFTMFFFTSLVWYIYKSFHTMNLLMLCFIRKSKCCEKVNEKFEQQLQTYAVETLNFLFLLAIITFSLIHCISIGFQFRVINENFPTEFLAFYHP